MSEKILYEQEINFQGSENIQESTPNAPETIMPGTGQTDIAQQIPKSILARNVVSQSLPFMIGYVQPLNTPSGFVFGFKARSDTSITHNDFPYSNQRGPSEGTTYHSGESARTRIPADPMTDSDQDGLNGAIPAETASNAPADDTDPVIVRRMVETETREVIFNLTNEVIYDIQKLFKDDFPNLLQKFIQNGGELYGFPESDTDTGLKNFFLGQMMSVATKKINTDFINWANSTAKNIGTVTIPESKDMHLIFNAIGELRESLSEQTNKSGSIFVITSPRIANYIAGTLGMTNSNGGYFLEKGKPNQNSHLNGFVGQYGDVKVYQYRGDRDFVGEEVMILGFDGENGPNTSSVYYHPYKEYLIQGGDDYQTGHSNVFYRVRDTWGTNPLDTFDQSQTNPIMDPGNNNPSMTGTSQFLVKAVFNIQERIIQ